MDARKLLRENEIIQEYLSILENIKAHLIVIAVKDTPGFELTEEINRQLGEIGITSDLTGKHWHGYIAVINNGKTVYEELGGLDQAVAKQMEICPGLKLRVVSKPLNAGNDVEIVINGTDHAVKGRGLNIVVYDTQRRYVIDSVCFDTHVKNGCCFRRNRNEQNKEEKVRDDIINDIAALKDRLAIQNIIPMPIHDMFVEKQQIIQKKQKIEVRIFFFGAPILWNSLRSIALEFGKDQRFHVLVILEYDGGKVIGKEAVVKNDGLEYINSEEWDVCCDQPDILVSNSDEVPSIERKYVKFWIMVPFALINGHMPSGEALTELLVRRSDVVDYVFVEKFLYGQIKSRHEKNNIVEMGNPKFDLIYEKVNHEKILPRSWEKIKGKKVILWTTDHVWNTSNVTFDLYINAILEYFGGMEDSALIIRPHYSYIHELLTNDVWTSEGYSALKEYMNRTSNIVWDETDDYSLAYSLADAVLSDVNCGITVSALVLNKPLGIMMRYDGNQCKPHQPDLVSRLYQIDSWEACRHFLDMVLRGQDPMKEVRQEACRQYISYFDGQNGRRIKEFIMKKYLEKTNMPKIPGGGKTELLIFLQLPMYKIITDKCFMQFRKRAEA